MTTIRAMVAGVRSEACRRLDTRGQEPRLSILSRLDIREGETYPAATQPTVWLKKAEQLRTR